MQIKSFLASLATRVSTFFSADKSFELILTPGQTEYLVTPPKPGTYWIVACVETKVPVGLKHFVDFSWDQGPIQNRLLLKAKQTKRNMQLERVVFAAGQTRKLNFVYNTEQANVSKLIFRPLLPTRIPKEALNYRPPFAPPAQHPRVLVNPAYLLTLRNNLNVGENAAVWNRVATLAQEPYELKLEPNKELGFQDTLISIIRQKALYYLLTSDKKVGQETIELTRKYMDNVACGNGQDICRKNGENIFTAALVYDWCYDLLTEEDKRALHDRMLYFVVEMETGWPPFVESAAFGHANEAQISRDELAMAIALYDENQEPYRYVMYQMLKNLKPVKNFMLQSGRHDQGSSYGEWRYTWELFGALQFRRTFNMELLPQEAAQVPYAWYYIRTPDGRLLCEGDSSWQWTPKHEPLSTQLLLTSLALYPDPEIKSDLYRSDPEVAQNMDPVFFLLTNDPNLQAKDLRATLPTTKFFKNPLPGLYLRTGWNFSTDSDDAVVTMNGAQYHYRNHQHLDMGAFQIYYRGNLVADLGQYHYYGVPYDWNLAKTSALHSLMRFQDPEQTQWNMGDFITVNCGGEEINGWSPAPDLKTQLNGDFYRCGSTPAAGFGPDKVRPVYNFMEIDLGSLFPGRVNDYTRTFVFLNQESAERPGTLLILDRFHTAKSCVQPIFQLTSINRPVWENNVLKIRTSQYGRVGQLTVQPLIPSKTQANILTGKDAHTFAGTYIPAIEPDQLEANGSRTELTGEGNIYLNALQIHDGNTVPLPITQIQENDRISVDIDTSTTAEFGGYLVQFGNTLKPTEDRVSFYVPRNRMRVLLLDLAPGYWACGQNKVNVESGNGSVYFLLDQGTYLLTPGEIVTPGLDNKEKQTPQPAQNS